MKSVLQPDKECYVCHSLQVHEHHVYFGPFRKKSEKLGMKIYLCPYHHNMSDAGIHFNREFDLEVKRMAQEYYEANIGSRADFINDFGRNYL